MLFLTGMGSVRCVDACLNKFFCAASALQDSYFSIFFYLYVRRTSLWWSSAEGKKDKTENAMLLRLTEKLLHSRTTTFAAGEWRREGLEL